MSEMKQMRVGRGIMFWNAKTEIKELLMIIELELMQEMARKWEKKVIKLHLKVFRRSSFMNFQFYEGYMHMHVIAKMYLEGFC